MKQTDTSTSMRLDKWLWAARFFKTRSLAQKHIELGRILVNGSKIKSSKNITAGDEIHLTLNSLPYKITVLALNHQRRPAPEARALYAEDTQTRQLRESQKALADAVRNNFRHPDGRPTKRDRRLIDKAKRGFFDK